MNIVYDAIGWGHNGMGEVVMKECNCVGVE